MTRQSYAAYLYAKSLLSALIACWFWFFLGDAPAALVAVVLALAYYLAARMVDDGGGLA